VSRTFVVRTPSLTSREITGFVQRCLSDFRFFCGAGHLHFGLLDDADCTPCDSSPVKRVVDELLELPTSRAPAGVLASTEPTPGEVWNSEARPNCASCAKRLGVAVALACCGSCALLDMARWASFDPSDSPTELSDACWD
jgi:hypothetical protein